MRIDLELCLPRDAMTLPVIRHVARCALKELGVTPSAVDDVGLALTEACTNVVKHSGVDEAYEVHLLVSDNVCPARSKSSHPPRPSIRALFFMRWFGRLF